MDTEEKKVRIALNVPEELIKRVDRLASRTYSTRTYWVIQALLEKLQKEELKDREKISA